MHRLWRLNRTETVAVQTNYVPAQHELQVSDAMAGDAALNSLYVGAGPRGASICKSMAVGVIPPVTLRPTQLGVQEGERAIPRQRRGGGIVGIRAIWLEEPVCGPLIGIEGGLFARRLEFAPQLCDRLWRLERVILGEVAEIGCPCGGKVQTCIGGVK